MLLEDDLENSNSTIHPANDVHDVAGVDHGACHHTGQLFVVVVVAVVVVGGRIDDKNISHAALPNRGPLLTSTR